MSCEATPKLLSLQSDVSKPQSHVSTYTIFPSSAEALSPHKMHREASHTLEMVPEPYTAYG